MRHRGSSHHTTQLIAVIVLFVVVGLVVIITTATRSQPPAGHFTSSPTHPSTGTPSTAAAGASPTTATLPSQPQDLAACISAINTGTQLVQQAGPLTRTWKRYLDIDAAGQASPAAVAALQRDTTTALQQLNEVESHSVDPAIQCNAQHQISPPSQYCLTRSAVVSAQMSKARVIVNDLRSVLGQQQRLDAGQLNSAQFAQQRREHAQAQWERADIFLGPQTEEGSAAQRTITETVQCVSGAAPIISGSASASDR